MKKIIQQKWCISGSMLLLAATTALAADPVMTENRHADRDSHYDPGDVYRACELSLDVFGTASIGQYTFDHFTGDRVRHDARLGVGLGLNYFFTRNFGIGADMYSENTTGAFVDSASANLLFRMPLGQSGVAPYVFGGGGKQFDLVQAWFAQVGAGIEYRCCTGVGIFTDVRWVVPEETKNYGVARLGVRFAF